MIFAACGRDGDPRIVRWQPRLLQTAARCIVRIVRWQPMLLQTAACMSIPDCALACPPSWIVTDCPITRDRVLTAGGIVTDCPIN